MRKVALASAFIVAVAGLAGLTGLAWRADAAAPKVFAFTGVFTGGQESTPVSTSGMGVAFATFDDGTKSLAFSYSVTGTGFFQGAHIHGPAVPGSDADVIAALPNSTSANGSVVLTADQAKALKKGLLYMNIHTSPFPNGEIRAQLLPAGVTYRAPQ